MKTIKTITCLVVLICGSYTALAMPNGVAARTEARTFAGADGSVFRYRWAEKLPENGSKVPLVIFLHGAGERGTNNVSQLRHGVGELLDWLDRHEKGYRLVVGQVPNGKRWVEVDWNAKSHAMPKKPSETMALELALLDRLLADPRTDAQRVYVTGISMGGYGTWDIVCRRPGMFAAAMPICGGGDTAQAANIAHVPIWVFHGSADRAVPVCRSRNMVSALWSAGSNAHYVVLLAAQQVSVAACPFLTHYPKLAVRNFFSDIAPCTARCTLHGLEVQAGIPFGVGVLSRKCKQLVCRRVLLICRRIVVHTAADIWYNGGKFQLDTVARTAFHVQPVPLTRRTKEKNTCRSA